MIDVTLLGSLSVSSERGQSTLALTFGKRGDDARGLTESRDVCIVSERCLVATLLDEGEILCSVAIYWVGDDAGGTVLKLTNMNSITW